MSLLSKFRGGLMGGLLGDCLGAPFEMESPSIHQVNLYIQQLYDPKLKVPFKPYTDDTVMTIGVAETLIRYKDLPPKELAKRFTVDYFSDPKRGYGPAVHDVFMNLRTNGFDDPFYAAKKQFQGSGSFGNGAAMRIAPIALFAYDDKPKLIALASIASRITHSHPQAVKGAILQALAVREALLHKPGNPLDSVAFVRKLRQEMDSLDKEVQDPFTPVESSPTYHEKLQLVEEFLQRDEPPLTEEVQTKLGVGVAAIHSVPTAIYTFLRANQSTHKYQFDNEFVRVIGYAISLGGDTDTIASMGGTLAGAFWGYEKFPDSLKKHCEKSNEMLKLGDQLHEVCPNIISQSIIS